MENIIRSLLSFLSLFAVVKIYSQIGINTPNPKATLHITKKETIPTLILSGIEQKEMIGTETQNYIALVIGDDGAVKKDVNKIAGGLKYNLRETMLFKYDSPITLKFVDPINPNSTTPEGYLILPDDGAYAISFRFYGAPVNRPTPLLSNSTFGQVYLKITNFGTGSLLDQTEMTWLASSVQERFSYSVTMMIYGKKGTVIKADLSKDGNTVPWGINLTGSTNQNVINTTTIIVWKI